MWAIALFRGL